MSRLEFLLVKSLRSHLSRGLIHQSRYGRITQTQAVTDFNFNIQKLSRNYSDSSEDGKSGKAKTFQKSENKYESDKKTKTDQKQGSGSAAAKSKLNDLLKSIVADSNSQTTSPKSAENKTGAEKKMVNMQLAGFSRKKNLEKYENEKTKSGKDSADPKPKTAQDSADLSPELRNAVKTVAGALGGDPEVTETELVQKLRAQTKLNMSELFVGMKIDRSEKRDTSSATAAAAGPPMSRAQYVRKQFSRDQPRDGPRPSRDEREEQQRQRRTQQQQQQRVPQQYTHVGLFQSKPLGIFSVKPSVDPPIVPTLKTWDAIHAKELKLAVTHPPANGFEEMILWTETGRLWKFPIDNEQDIGDEVNCGFQEHVFLTPHLDPWCPKKGPIRHFMEVVCSALGKNSYLSAQEKRECIEWYHTYFKNKSDIIKEVGAGNVQ